MRIHTRSATRAVAALAAASMVTLGLAACGGSSSSGDGGKGAKQFTYWSMWTEDEPVAKVLKKALASFQQDTGVKVDVQWQGRDVLTKVKAALNTSTVPDLVDQGSPALKATLALSHQALDMKSVYDMSIPGESGKTVRDAIPQSYDALDSADGKLITVPYDVSATSWWFSGKAYPDLVAHPPTTWSDFTRLFPAIKSKGQAPIAQDADLLGYDATFVYAALARALGPGNLHQIVADHTGNSWDNPKVKAALTEIEKLATDKDYLPGYDASKYPAMEKDWAHGKAAFIYMGSWVPQYDGPDAAKDFDLHTFNFPQLVGTDVSVPVTTYGYAIPTTAKNAAAAKQFIAYFMGTKWATQLSQDATILTPNPSVAVPDALHDLQAMLKNNNIYMANDGVTGDYPDLNKQLNPLNQGLITGKLKADQYITQAKTIQAQYWKLNG
jgi:raffinose/stachyose/melibiose transport system substrate-binding protein